MKYKLVCDQNPRTLGIEDAEGNWDMKKFKDHVKICPQCGEFSERVLENIKNKFLGGKGRLIENNEFDEFVIVLEVARWVVEQKRPEASPQKKAAFANSVAYLVTGWRGGQKEYHGPSVREHAVVHRYGPGGRHSFEGACDLLLKDDGVIFGPITDLHRKCWVEEFHQDDDPQDRVAIEG